MTNHIKTHLYPPTKSIKQLWNTSTGDIQIHTLAELHVMLKIERQKGSNKSMKIPKG